jgi:predicted DNA-binding transcriptional regulator YafY
MSVTRIHRLVRLITVLQSGRARSADDLAAELGVSRRTLFRDLKLIQDAGVPCYHESGVGYRMAQGFYLPPINLTVPETLGLLLLGKSASAQPRRPLVGPALSAITKLVSTLPGPIRAACTDLMADVSVSAAGQLADGDAEARVFTTLQRCIDEGRYCQLTYQSPVEAEPLVCRLAPYALHFATRAWYVFGRTDVHGEVRVFKLARIRGLSPLNRRFDRPHRFRVEDKLGQAWQLIPEGKVHDIELEFTAKVATNVCEVKWHPTQKHRLLPDGRCRMSFQVDGLGEIAWWVCGYADQVRVVRPKALRDRVTHMLRSALAAQHNGRK